jgi:GH15 family glucan-1,4-alpha-glucosidase
LAILALLAIPSGASLPCSAIIYFAVARGQTSKIQDYGVIGDCRAAALVSRYGSIDWLCWPRFDSPPVFAALLDEHRECAGYWSVSPTRAAECKHAYVPDSNVLETYFTSTTGSATLTDLMPVTSEAHKRRNLIPDHELLRQIECTAGEMEIAIAFRPRFGFDSKPQPLRKMEWGLRIDVGRGAYWLRSSVPLNITEDGAYATVALKHGEVLQFAFTYSEESPAVLPALGERVRAAIDRSVIWWQQWAAQAKYEGPYRSAVVRSALALKLLAYAPSGAVVAAATTSLPERIGDTLNWDYRYCWLRDASLTVRGLVGLGYMDEAEAFLNWLLHATRLTQPQLRVLYTVFGAMAPREKDVQRLSGYLGSQPVREGNGARHQLQLDVYGEVIDASAQYAQHIQCFDRSSQKALIGMGKYVADNWDQPDEGIWEPRSGRENNTYSRLLCWTALDRLLALNEKGIVNGVPRAEFTRERERIRQQIETRAWNATLQTYVSTLEGNELDAGLLRIPWYGFEEAGSERMKSTYRAIRKGLGAGNGLLYRYRREPPEGAFGICGFWAVEHLALGGGSLEDAHSLFDRLLRYGNGLGLFAEEIDPESGDAMGNFPQAFTHVGLISAALTLEEKERGESHPAVQTGSDVRSSGQEARA